VQNRDRSAIFTSHFGLLCSQSSKDAKNCNGIANAVDTCTMQTIGPASSSFSSAFLLTLFSLSQDFLPPWDLKVVSSGFPGNFHVYVGLGNT